MKTILCYGDSNTFGYRPDNGMRFDRDTRWPGRLQSLLGDDYYVVEEGCNGRTTLFEENGEEWKSGMTYLRPCLNSHKPLDLLIIMLGSNDLKNMFGADAQTVAKGVDEIIRVSREFLMDKQGFAPEILLISPPLIGENIAETAFRDRFESSAHERSKGFAGALRAVAEAHGCRFLDAAEHVKASDIDCLHLEAEGHRALADAVYEEICR